jgi:hypothetical protein
MGGGGSFLGTAAATVAGVVGGAMLLNGIRSMMGHEMMGHETLLPGHDPASGVTPGASPWDSGGGQGDLARDAGLSDIDGHRASAYDNSAGNDDGGFLGGNVDDLAGSQPDDDFDGGDFDGGDGGDFDTA